MRFFQSCAVFPLADLPFARGSDIFLTRRNGSRLRIPARSRTTDTMEQMLICLSLALIAGLLMSRLAKAVNLPAVTSYLIAGLLLGPFFLGRLGLSRLGFGFGSLAQVEGYGIITQVATASSRRWRWASSLITITSERLVISLSRSLNFWILAKIIP